MALNYSNWKKRKNDEENTQKNNTQENKSTSSVNKLTKASSSLGYSTWKENNQDAYMGALNKVYEAQRQTQEGLQRAQKVYEQRKEAEAEARRQTARTNAAYAGALEMLGKNATQGPTLQDTFNRDTGFTTSGTKNTIADSVVNSATKDAYNKSVETGAKVRNYRTRITRNQQTIPDEVYDYVKKQKDSLPEGSANFDAVSNLVKNYGYSEIEASDIYDNFNHYVSETEAKEQEEAYKGLYGTTQLQPTDEKLDGSERGIVNFVNSLDESTQNLVAAASVNDDAREKLAYNLGWSDEKIEYATEALDKYDDAKKRVEAADEKAYKNQRQSSLPEEDQELFKQLARSRFNYDKVSDFEGLFDEVGIRPVEDVEADLKDKGYSDEEIEELSEYYAQDLKAEMEGDLTEFVKEDSKSSTGKAVMWEALDILTQPFAVADAAESIVNNVTGKKDADYNLFSTMSDANKEAWAERIGEDNGLGQFAYGVVDSTLRAGYMMMLGGGMASELGMTGKAAKAAASAITLPSFGASAYNSAYQDAIDQGFDDSTAFKVGLANGLFEMAFEEISLDHIYNIIKNPAKAGAKELLKDVLVQGLIEGSEEGATDLADWMADSVIKGDYSEYNMMLDEYMSQGMSKEEATRKVLSERAGELFSDMAAGAISGFAMGGGATAVSALNSRSLAQSVKDAGSTSVLWEIGQNAPKESSIYEITSTVDPEEATVGQIAEVIRSAQGVAENETPVRNILTEALQTSENVSQEEAEQAVDAFLNGNAEESRAEETKGQEKANTEPTKATNKVMELAQKVAGVAEKSVSEADTVGNDILAVTSMSKDYADKQKAQRKETVKSVKNFAKENGTQEAEIDGKKVQVVKVANADTRGNARVYAVNDSGKTISASLDTVNFADENLERVIRGLQKTEDAEAVNIAIKHYKNIGSTPVESYINYGNVAYEAGNILYRNGITEENYQNFKSNESFRNDVMLNEDDYLREMFFRGVATAENRAKAEEQAQGVKESAKAKLGTVTDAREDASDDGYKAIADKVAKATGLHVVLADNSTTDANGSFVASLGTLLVNTDGKNPVAAMVHELSEFGKAYNSEKMDKFVGAVLDYANSDIGAQALSETLEQYRDAYREFGLRTANAQEAGKQIEEAGDEFVFDALGGMFTTKEGLKAFNDFLDENITDVEERKSIKQVLMDILNKIVSVLTGGTKGVKYGQSIDEKKAKELRDTWAELIGEAKANLETAKAKETTETKTQYSAEFSLDVPVEQRGNLIAIHNLSSDEMMKTLKLGGFPMPSIAITKADMGHDMYGNISVLFRSESIDPEFMRRNKVYSGDAYTPEFPQIDYKINSKAIDRVRKTVQNLTGDLYGLFGHTGLDVDNAEDKLGRNQGSVVDAYGSDDTLEYAFTKAQGADIEVPMKEKKISYHYGNDEIKYIALMFTPEEAVKHFQGSYADYEMLQKDGTIDKIIAKLNAFEKKKYSKSEKLYEKLHTTELSFNDFNTLMNAIVNYNSNGVKEEVDKLALGDTVHKYVMDHYAEYTSWLNDLFDGVIEKAGLRNQKDMFTPSGNRRSFESLHYDYNLANIVKAMSEEPETGKGFGGYSFLGSVSREFDSIEDIHSEEGRLKVIDENEYSKLQKEIEDDLHDVALRLRPNSGYNEYEIMSDIAEAVAKRKTVNGVKNFLSEWYDVSDEDIADIMELKERAASLPTGYFEAKPQRAVGLDEIAEVVVPDLETDLIEALEEKNIPHVTYKAGDKESRKEAVNSVDDVKFSLDVDTETRYSNEVYDDEELTEVASADRFLTKAVDVLKEGSKISSDIELDEKQVKKIAQEIVREYSSDIPVKDLSENIYKAFAYMKKNGTSHEAMLGVMEQIARPVVESSKIVDSDLQKQFNDVRSYLKSHKITLNSQQRGDAASEFGSYNDFRKKAIGMMNIGNGGISLDSIWPELVEMSGNVLDITEPDASQPSALVNYMEGLRRTTNPYGQNIEEASLDLAMNIYGKYYEVLAQDEANRKAQRKIETLQKNLVAAMKDYKKSTSENYRRAVQEEMKLARAEKAEQMEALRQTIAQTAKEESEATDDVVKAQLEAQRLTYEYEIDKIKEQNEKQIASVKATYKNLRRTEAYRRANTRLKHEVASIHDSLAKMLVSPRTDGYVSEVLVSPVIDMLKAINIDTGKSMAIKAKLERLSKAYARFETDKYKLDYDPNLQKDITELSQMFDGVNYTELSNEQLERVIQIAKALRQQVRNANRMILNQKEKDAFELRKNVIEEIQKSRGVKNAFDEVLNQYNTWHLNGYREFRKLSGYVDDGYLMSMWDEFQQGELKQISFQKEANEIFAPYIQGNANQKNLDRLSSTKDADLVDVGLKDSEGKPVKVTRAMRLSLIMNSKNDRNVAHVLGGVTVPDLKKYEAGKYTQAFNGADVLRYVSSDAQKNLAIAKSAWVKAKKFGTSAEVQVAERNLEEAQRAVNVEVEVAKNTFLNLEKDLTEWEKGFLKACEEFFWNFTGDEINKVTREIRGYDVARVKNYFPIKTNPEFTRTEFAGLIQDASLEGWGNLKSRTNAANPILLEDITNVIMRQINKTSQYVGYAIPVRDFNMLTQGGFTDESGNRTGLVNAINKKWGPKGKDVEFLRNFIQDIQGGRRSAEGTFGQNFMKLRSNFAASTLTGNLSVAMKQFASYPTAAAVLGHKVMMKTLPEARKSIVGKGIEELEAINPLLWNRTQGLSSDEIAYSKQSWVYKKMPTWLKKISVDMIQSVDTFTVRLIEYGAKNYVDMYHKELEKGSPEYWDKVSEMFTKVVTETQPNYTTLQRPDVLRETNTFLKQLVMFKTQPLQNFGIVYDSFNDMRMSFKRYQGNKSKETKAKYEKSVHGFARALSSQMSAAIVFGAMTILGNFLKHKIWKYDQDDDKTMLEEALATIPSSMLSTAMGAFTFGDYAYQFIDEKFLGGTWYGMEISTVEMINGLKDSFDNLVKKGEALTDAETTAEKEKALKNFTTELIDGLALVGNYTGIPTKNISDYVQSAYLYSDELLNDKPVGSTSFSGYDVPTQGEMMVNAILAGDTDTYTDLSDEWAEIKGSNPKTRVRSSAKKMYLDGDITKEEAVKVLKEIDEKDPYSKIAEWEAGVITDEQEATLEDGYSIDDYFNAVTDDSARINEVKKFYQLGKLSKTEAVRYLRKCGIDKDKAEKRVEGWTQW